MDCRTIILALADKGITCAPQSVEMPYADEIRLQVPRAAFKDACVALHGLFVSPVMTFFAADERAQRHSFVVRAAFLSAKEGCWVIVSTELPADAPAFESLAKTMHSASLFEREIREMFGIEVLDSPDTRRLHLHDEIWPSQNYPLRKDFTGLGAGETGEYRFARVEGDGVYEVPVGPVHAGIIGPGHFRFSVAGEPIINLEMRLGFTHRGVEKLCEGKTLADLVRIAECVSGDAACAHSMACVQACEKIAGIVVSPRVVALRALFLELERLYNHINDIGGIATDVSFTFPAAYASLAKEKILRLNEQLTGSRYLKGVTTVGGVTATLDIHRKMQLTAVLKEVEHDIRELSAMLWGSVSFMDRLDTTGILRAKTAEDLGIVGCAGRASGIARDLRAHFPGVWTQARFNMAVQSAGDVLARLQVRFDECRESCRLIAIFATQADGSAATVAPVPARAGSALGYSEGWRGPVLYWVATDVSGRVTRCKITDASFHNWQGLSYAVLGNIIPDFPLCNKSFDLSYAGNDL